MKGKILLVTSEFGKQGGGLSNSAYLFSNYLNNRGIDFEVIISSNINNGYQFPKEFKNDNFIINNSLSVINGGYNNKLSNDLFFRANINNQVIKYKDSFIESIIAFGAGNNGLFASELAIELNAKLIVMPRGSELNLAISNAELYHSNLICLKRATAVVSISEEISVRGKRIYYNPKTLYDVIPNIINVTETIKLEKFNNNKTKFILGTGAKFLNEKKGIANLIQSLYYLNKLSDIKFHLKLVGFIDYDLLENYKKLINSLSLNSYVSFVGVLDRDLYVEEIKSWDIALQGSFCEGFSNSIGDAISVGVPFIITNTGYVAEALKDEFPELIIFVTSPEDIAKKIYETCLNKNLGIITNNAINFLNPMVNQEAVYKKWDIFFNRLNSCTTITSKSINDNSIVSVLLHDVTAEIISNVDISVKKLEELCELLFKSGYVLCSAKKYFQCDDKSNLIICTFDDAYSGIFNFAFPIFKQYNFTATIFVCSEYIDVDNSWNKKDKTNRKHLSIKELQNLKVNGWEIGSHGTNHISFLRLDEIEILKNIKESKDYLSNYFGDIVSFALPYGDTSPLIESIVSKHYENVFTVNSGGTNLILDRHRIRRYTFNEIQNLFSI